MTTTRRLLFLVEEPSMEAFLRGLISRILSDSKFDIRLFQGKRDTMKNLRNRLRAYSRGCLKIGVSS